MRPKEKFTTPLISIKAIIKSHLKHIIDLAIMSSEMIIVNIRRRNGKEDEKFHRFCGGSFAG
jgi:hypothetical protein